MKFYFLRYLLMLLLLGNGFLLQAQCGFDIFVANDQSSSMDATENKASRDFILKLAQTHTLGTDNDQNRIAIADWSDGFQPYSFPGAGAGYTTDISDVLAYKDAPRVFNGNTNINSALLNSYNQTKHLWIPGRTARKLMIILTDLSSAQVGSNITGLATAVKDAGGIVAVIGIADAAHITLLEGSNVASDASLFFPVDNASMLITDAIYNSVLSAACASPVPAPNWDLSVHIDAADCGTGQVSYTVTNEGPIDYSGNLSISFFDGNPAFPGARLLATDVKTSQHIASGATSSLTSSDPALLSKGGVCAVVNLDVSGSNAVAPIPTNLSSRLADPAEQNPTNNISTVAVATGCPAASPQLEVSNTATSLSCDKTVTYQVRICNTGSVAAQDVMPVVVPSTNDFTLKNVTTTIGDAKMQAPYADPGDGTVNDGYSGYQRTAMFPCPSNDISTTCTGSSGFSYVQSFSSMFLSNGVFSFPVVNPGSGVPAGAIIISAKLTARTGNNGIIGGIKRPDVQKFNGVINHPGDLWLSAPTQTTVPTPASGLVINVTTIAQELVSQPGWTANSTMAFIWHGAKTIVNGWVNGPTLEVTYLLPQAIAAGECATFTYQFQDTTGNAGTFHASAGVTTTTSGAIFLPNNNFTTNGVSGLNGYDGEDAANTTDNVTIPATSPCSVTAQPITASVVIDATSVCAGPGNYVTALVTINNPNTEPIPNGITLNDLLQHFELTGTGAKFNGEPYSFTNGLVLVTPNVLDPAYPAVPNAISGKSGVQDLSLLRLPPGTSTFKVDIEAGTGDFNLAAAVTGIPSSYNISGATNTVTDATGVVINPAPAITWTCPAPVTAGTDIAVSALVTGAAELHIVSATAGEITNAGTLTEPAATYTPTATDIANGYASFTLTVLSSSGCDASISCQVAITGASYDYGDAPGSYDLNKTSVAAAGGNTLSPGLYLGNIAPSAEAAVKSSDDADGDGAEEDGLTGTEPVMSGGGSTATYKVRVTNNTASDAYMSGFVDYNGNGNLLEEKERSALVTVAANSGTMEYDLVFSGIPSTGVPPTSFMRLRVSTDQGAVQEPYGAAPNGEVEDFLVSTGGTVLPILLQSFTAAAHGCDVQLKWSVENAAQFSHFILERSNNGLVFQPLKNISYDAARKEYTFTDKQPGSGKWYYRLKEVDMDGMYKYSEMAQASVHCEEDAIKIYPTIVGPEVQVSLPPAFGTAEITLSNTAGQRLNVPVAGSGNLKKINTSALTPGIYFIQVIRTGSVRTFKIVKE